MAIIGLANLHYAIMTAEDTAETAATYDTPKRLVGINSVSIQPTNETSTLYGDNKALATVTNTKEFTISLEVAKLPTEDEAALLGHSYDSSTSVMTVKGNDTPPYIALLFDAGLEDGTTEYVKFFKGKMAPAQQDMNTRGDTLDYGLHSLEGTFVARTKDDKVYETKVTSETSVATSWYASVDG